jgi:hypothetical protein
MEWTLTFAAIGFGIVLTLLSIWQSGRPRKDSLSPRWIPWRFLILVGGAVLALGAVHALTLLGFTPMRPTQP